MLADEDDDPRAKFIATGAIEPLVDLMRDGSDVGKKRAAIVLYRLTEGDIDKDLDGMIVAAGAIEALVQMLRSGIDDDAKEQAADLLVNLAWSHPTSGVALLRNGNESAKEKAVEQMLEMLGMQGRYRSEESLDVEDRAKIVAGGAIDRAVGGRDERRQ